MAGHSKWSQIKHKKAKLDTKRGKAFTKLIKEITVCARLGGGDPDGNARLRLLMEKAKEINMPQQNITRAIKKGTGELPGAQYEGMTYEGYGPSGIAVLVETLTDNKNRTVAELRHLFGKKGGNLSETGSVAWMFEKLGVIHCSGETSEDQLLEALIDYDVTNITKGEGNLFTISCYPKELDKVKKVIEGLGLKVEGAGIEWLPKDANKTNLEGTHAEKAYEFLEAIDDLDDTQNVYTNLV